MTSFDFKGLNSYQANCPIGCPCPDYDCNQSTTPSLTSTTTAPTETGLTNNILVLDNFNSENVPMVVFANGTYTTSINFNFGQNTESLWSCGLVFQNQALLFGGNNQRTQISKVCLCLILLIHCKLQLASYISSFRLRIVVRTESAILTSNSMREPVLVILTKKYFFVLPLMRSLKTVENQMVH